MESHMSEPQRGTAASETVVLLTLLVVIVFGILDMGGALFNRVAIDDAVRIGATYASLSETATIESIESRVHAAIGRPGLSSAPITIECSEQTIAGQTTRFVEISLSYEQRLITPIASWLSEPILMTATAKIERYAEGQPCD
jgi:Flp pilus assembly protein TadG